MKSLDRVNQDLKRELDDLQQKLHLKRDESDSLQRRFKVGLDLHNVCVHVYLHRCNRAQSSVRLLVLIEVAGAD